MIYRTPRPQSAASFFCSSDHIGLHEEVETPLPVVTMTEVGERASVAGRTAMRSGRPSNHMIVFILPDVAGAGQFASSMLTNIDLAGVLQGKILQSGMSTSGGQGLMAFRVEFTLEEGISPEEVQERLQTYCRERMRRFLAMASTDFSLEPGAVRKSDGEFHVNVFPHDPSGEDRAIFPTFSLLARGPGNSGDQALILDNLLKGANNLVSVRELAAMHYAPDRSVVKVVFELRDPISETGEEIAAQMEGKLSEALPEYTFIIDIVKDPLWIFGHAVEEMVGH